MITRKKSLLVVAFIAATSICFVSCKKDGTERVADVESAENNALSESTFNDVTTLVDQSVSTGGVIMGQSGTASNNEEQGALGADCASVSLDTTSTNRSVIIDFGTTNCLCKDGRNRRGKIITTYTGRYKAAGTIVSFSFDNYFVNDHKITGSKTVTNMGVNAAGHWVYSVEVNGQIIKANNGGTITWTSTRQREWVAGQNTPLILTDDMYSITGTASGTNASGISYTIAITQPLIRNMSCKWFESGKCDITQSNKPSRTLDYGTSGCDANATLTIEGKTHDITLK